MGDRSLFLPLSLVGDISLRVSLCVGVWQHDRVEIIANVPLHSRFLLRSHTQTPFPHWISQNEIIKVTDNNYRPDLTKAALARLSAVNRSLKVAKSGAKKWNMQALKKQARFLDGFLENALAKLGRLNSDGF